MFSVNKSNTVLLKTTLCEDIRTIRLRRNGTAPLGFAIRGGWEHGTGIFVSEVYTDSEAEKEGLKPGDQILRVNGFSIEQAIHDEVISLIKSATRIVLRVKSVGMIPVKENRTEPIQWKIITDIQQSKPKVQQNQINNFKNKTYKQKTKCPVHSLNEKNDQKVISNILLKETKKLQPKTSNLIGSAGSSPTSSVSSKSSSSSITSSCLSSCSKLIAKSCKTSISSSSSQPKNKLTKFYSRSLSNLTSNTDFVDEFSLTSTSTINFTRNKSTSNVNLNSSTSISPEITSSSTEDISSYDKNEANNYSTIFVNLTKGENLGCSVVKGPASCPGIFIQTVKQNGVAEKAGLEIGDQIISLNGFSCLPEHMQFNEAVQKIKTFKQIKIKVKKSCAIGLFLSQTVSNKSNKKISKKTIIKTNLSSSSSCNESIKTPTENLIINYRRSNKNSTSSRSNQLPYYMNKYSSRNNINSANGYFNESSSKNSLIDNKKSLRKGVEHHRSYTSLLSSNNSTYGKRMNGYHSPVCLRHSSTNYYTQSENDYSMYELEEHNEIDEKKLITRKIKENGCLTNENHSFCKNKKFQYKSKSIKNLSRNFNDCEKCKNVALYSTDCDSFDFNKTTFNFPLNNSLLKQKLLCNNLSCSNLTFKSQTDIGLTNCQQMYSILNNQMNALKINNLKNDFKSKSTLNLNDDLLINNSKIYEKMRLEQERLVIERKKLETEQLRLQEEKNELEREKKKIENLKQQDEQKSISSSSTVSAKSKTIPQSNSSTCTQNIGFLDEIKKLAERRACENSLITDTLNKTRFNTGQSDFKSAVRLLPIADSNNKIKQLHPDDEKRKRHELLMEEFRAAHQRMFGNNGHKTVCSTNSTKPILNTETTSSNSSSENYTPTILSKNSNLVLTEKLPISNNNEKNDSTIDLKMNNEKIVYSDNKLDTHVISNSNKIQTENIKTPIPPPLPNLNNIKKEIKQEKLNTFGKVIVSNENLRNNSENLIVNNSNLYLKKNNKQNETVKILRTSSPNKKRPAPLPPTQNNLNKKTDSNKLNLKNSLNTIRMSKIEENMPFENNNFVHNQVK